MTLEHEKHVFVQPSALVFHHISQQTSTARHRPLPSATTAAGSVLNQRVLPSFTRLSAKLFVFKKLKFIIHFLFSQEVVAVVAPAGLAPVHPVVVPAPNPVVEAEPTPVSPVSPVSPVIPTSPLVQIIVNVNQQA